jgi:hypothetical protein
MLRRILPGAIALGLSTLSLGCADLTRPNEITIQAEPIRQPEAAPPPAPQAAAQPPPGPAAAVPGAGTAARAAAGTG